MVEEEGFEPSKAEPPDLQSDPFNRSGTLPKNLRGWLGDGMQRPQGVANL